MKVNNILQSLIARDYELYYNKFIPRVMRQISLPSYKHLQCSQSFGEYEYNKEIVKKRYSNDRDLMLLDRILYNGIEIADIYDNRNRIFYHNKKIIRNNGKYCTNSVRILCGQIIVGSIVLTDIQNRMDYNKLLGNKIRDFDDDDYKYSYVAGLILGKESNRERITSKDKILLCQTHMILKRNGVKMYIDEIY